MSVRVKVAEVSELESGDRKHVDIKGKEITVLNVDGTYYAVENYCPHMGGPVGNGPLGRDDEDSAIIMCPFHEWRFDLETGEVVFPSKKRVMTHDVSLEQYEVEVESEPDTDVEPGVYVDV
jgi:nitrite reductase/ring-hydroxylating ferredoxin subunit